MNRQCVQIIKAVLRHNAPGNPKALYHAVYRTTLHLGQGGKKAHDYAFFARTNVVFGKPGDTPHLPDLSG